MRTLGSGLSPLLPNEAFGRTEEPFLGRRPYPVGNLS